jgi:hypothetical protein
LNIPVLTILILIFVLWFQYEIRKGSKKTESDKDEFWAKEKEANLTRRKDISGLDYLTISASSLPMGDHEDDTLNSYRDTFRKMEGKKALNLSGKTNTELKLEYGAANLNQLMEYDNNFITFVGMLHKWADRLYTKGYVEEAKEVLEYGVACLTDVPKSYRLLAEIYYNSDSISQIDHLIETIANTKITDKEKLINELTAIKNRSK